MVLAVIINKDNNNNDNNNNKSNNKTVISKTFDQLLINEFNNIDNKNKTGVGSNYK